MEEERMPMEEELTCVSVEKHMASSAGDHFARLDLFFWATVATSKLYSTLQSPLSSPSQGSLICLPWGRCQQPSDWGRISFWFSYLSFLHPMFSSCVAPRLRSGLAPENDLQMVLFIWWFINTGRHLCISQWRQKYIGEDSRVLSRYFYLTSN